jgi:hypothetical protein
MVELYLHSPYLIMVWCLIKHRDNFTLKVHYRSAIILVHYRRTVFWEWKLNVPPPFFSFFLGGVRLSPLGTSATNWPIVPAKDDRWWWMWSSRWNKNWQGKLKYSDKTYPSATLSTTIPHDLTWARTRAASVGSRRLTAWAMARPHRFPLLWGMMKNILEELVTLLLVKLFNKL